MMELIVKDIAAILITATASYFIANIFVHILVRVSHRFSGFIRLYLNVSGAIFLFTLYMISSAFLTIYLQDQHPSITPDSLGGYVFLAMLAINGLALCAPFWKRSKELASVDYWH